MDYKDQVFDSVEVVLDGNSYEHCTFTNVIFRFGGGDLVMKNCGMDRFRFQFDGALSNGLYALYQLFGTEGMLQIIRGFLEPSESGEVELNLPG